MTPSPCSCRGSPTSPVPLFCVLNLDTDLGVRTGNSRFEGDSSFPYSGDRKIDPTMDTEEEASASQDRRLTMTDIKAGSSSKLECLIRPSIPFLLDCGVSVQPHSAYNKFPYSTKVEVAFLKMLYRALVRTSLKTSLGIRRRYRLL